MIHESELSGIEEKWLPVDVETAERYALAVSVLPALIDITKLSIVDEAASYALLSSLTDKCMQVCTSCSV
jgi:hypothetical protein